MGEKKILQLRAVSGALLAAAVYCLSHLIYSHTWIGLIISGFMTFMTLLLSAMTLDMSRMSPADSHTPLTLLLQYLVYRLFVIIGWRVFLGFEVSSMDTNETQSNLLRSIIEKNKDTSFGKAHGFGTMTSMKEFTSRMPLTTYKDYEDYVRRIDGGEQNVLTSDDVVFLAQSSGTTGKSKFIPVTNNMKGPAKKTFGPLMFFMMNRKCGLTLQRSLMLTHKSMFTHSPCGLKRGPVSGHMSRYIPYVTSPKEMYDISNEQAAIHMHAVFGFSDPEVGQIEALMSPLMYSFWRYVEHNWFSICDDIEQGALSPEIPTDSSIIDKLSSKLKPNPSRARELRSIYKHGMEGVARRIWPNLSFCRMLTTGGFSQHANYLREIHLKGVPQISQAHAASEGFFGFNLTSHPDGRTYTAMIKYAFMEFIPVQFVEEANPRIFLADELREGWSYEVVLTTPMGLYRYRTGDVIRVVGHFYETPVYTFEYRLGQILNVYWEKTPENVLYETIYRSLDGLDDVLCVDFTSTENVNLRNLTSDDSSGMKCYWLLIEVEKKNGESYILDKKEVNKFDLVMCHLNDLYCQARETDSVSAMKVIQLKPGTFEELKTLCIAETQNQQYKLPRVMRNEQRLRFLLSNAI